MGRLSPLPFPARKGADGRRRQAERARSSTASRRIPRGLVAIPRCRSFAVNDLRRRGKRRWILRSAGCGLSPLPPILAHALRRLLILGACLPLPFAGLAGLSRARRLAPLTGGIPLRRLRRGLEQLADARHPRGGHLLHRLDMLGELLERAGLELGVAHRLTDQLPPALGQAPQAAGVVPFPGRLLTDGLADLGGVELLGRHRLELFVAGEQFQLPVADLRRLLPPAADLFVDPQGMIGRAHDDKRRRRRTDPLPPGKKILHEGPHLDRLRRDAEARRRERPHRRERVGLRGPGRKDLFAAGSFLFAPHPLQPHLPHTEIIARLEREADRFRVEEHPLAPQPIDRDRRRLVVAGHEAHRERLASGEAEPIFPGEGEIDRRLDEDLRRHDYGRFRSDVAAVDRGAGQLPIGRRRHRHPAPLDDRQAPAAQPLRDWGVDAEVIGEADQR